MTFASLTVGEVKITQIVELTFDGLDAFLPDATPAAVLPTAGYIVRDGETFRLQPLDATNQRPVGQWQNPELEKLIQASRAP